MSWQLLIGLSVLFYSVVVLLQKTILKQKQTQPIAFSIAFQLACGLIALIVGFLSQNLSWPVNLNLLWLNLILAAFLYGFGNTLLFKSLHLIEASKLTIIFASRAPFTILASTLLLHEILSPKQLFGALLILLGTVFVSYKSNKLVFGKGEVFAVLAAMCFGFAVTNDRFIIQSIPVYSYMVYAFLSSAILMAIIYPQQIKPIKLFMNQSVFPRFFLVSLLYFLVGLTFYSALSIGNSSQIGTINLTSVVIIVLLSIIFLKERDNLFKKLLGALISFIGLLFVS